MDGWIGNDTTEVQRQIDLVLGFALNLLRGVIKKFCNSIRCTSDAGNYFILLNSCCIMPSGTTQKPA